MRCEEIVAWLRKTKNRFNSSRKVVMLCEHHVNVIQFSETNVTGKRRRKNDERKKKENKVGKMLSKDFFAFACVFDMKRK